MAWRLVFSLVGLLGVRLPLVDWTIPGRGRGVVGAWYAMAADLAVRPVLVTGRFMHGGWKRTKV